MSDSWHKPSREQRKQHLREQSVAQKETWDALTTMQKILLLDWRFGPNVGATKQRARLKTLLEKEHEAQEAKDLAKEKTKTEPTSRKKSKYAP